MLPERNRWGTILGPRHIAGKQADMLASQLAHLRASLLPC